MTDAIAKVLLGLIPDLVALIAEALRHPDPNKALRIGTAAIAADKSGHGAVDAMIDARKKT